MRKTAENLSGKADRSTPTQMPMLIPQAKVQSNQAIHPNLALDAEGLEEF
jgi:hypothetical protein